MSPPKPTEDLNPDLLIEDFCKTYYADGDVNVLMGVDLLLADLFGVMPIVFLALVAD